MIHFSQKRKILVTGGAGYIGSVVCELLEERSAEIVVVDDLREGNRKALPSKCHFYEADFGNPGILEEIFRKHAIEVVFHLAAAANVPDSVANPFLYYGNNFASTLNLLMAMNNYDVKRIIFSSTAAVYGEPVRIPIDEGHPTYPVNPYGFSKLMCEQLLKDAAVAYGIRHIVFRYFCAAGATEYHGESRPKETHLIPVILDAVLNKRLSISVFGNDYPTDDGSGVRDYVHVVDIARAHLMAMDKMDQLGDTAINLGTAQGFSVLQVMKAVEKLLAVRVRFSVESRRPGDPASLVASNALAHELLGWRPTQGLDDIIRSSFSWRQHPLY